MEIVRNPDGTLVVPVHEERHRATDDTAETSAGDADKPATQPAEPPTTRLLHPGEGGYDEALAEWDLQQNPERAPVVSTAGGRREAMTVVNAVGDSSDEAAAAVRTLQDPEAAGEALRTFSSAACRRSKTLRPRSLRQKAASPARAPDDQGDRGGARRARQMTRSGCVHRETAVVAGISTA